MAYLNDGGFDSSEEVITANDDAKLYGGQVEVGFRCVRCREQGEVSDVYRYERGIVPESSISCGFHQQGRSCFIKN